MFEPAHQRRASRLLKPQASPDLGHGGWGVLISIKSQGQWAVFAAPRTMATCLLRPGVLEFSGPAKEWGACVPRGCQEETGNQVVITSHAPTAQALATALYVGDTLLLAPMGEFGVMAIDYDARQALSMQTAFNPFGFDSMEWEFAQEGSDAQQWLMQMMSTGRMNRVRRAKSTHPEVSLPPPPPYHPNIFAWARAQSAAAFEIDPSQPSPSPVNLVMPLHAPGWSLVNARPGTPAAAAFLAGNGHLFHPAELDVWQDWAERNDYRDLVAATAAARLGAALPHAPSSRVDLPVGPSSPATPRPRL